MAIAVFAGVVGAVVAASFLQGTLGYDFLAYHQAIGRLLEGRPLYDMSFKEAGVFGLFFYPPTFVPLMMPFGLLTESVAIWIWTAVLVAAFLAGVALLPVPAPVRWAVLLLAGLSWPVAYAIKLGQVGPILFLLYAVAWRSMGSPRRLGVSAALGAAIKLQPGLLLGWALLERRFRAVGWGIATLVVLGAAATLLTGLGAWGDFLGLVLRVSDPIATPHNFTPGAVAFQLGVPRDAATALQFASTATALASVAVAVARSSPVAGLLVTVVASQLVSPVLWDHYAMLLLLPVAWLLAQHRYWAAVIPIATATPLALVTPAVVYPIAFWVTLIAALVVGWRTSAKSVLEPATA